MARFTVYSKDSQSVRYAGEPQYHGSYMGVDYIEFRTIASPVPISWEIGDYVDYSRTGMRYRLYGLPMPKKSARRNASGISFEYSNVQFFAATKELEIAPFRDLVTDDNRIHFSTRPEVATYENVYGIARRIQACMDDLYPGKWRIEVLETDDEDLTALLEETREFSVSNGSCLDALGQIYELWKNVGWTHFYDSDMDIEVITIGYANIRRESNTTDALAYGLGKGLTSIKKASANADQFATRLYVYGSERNIQTRYYNGFDIVDKDSVDIRNLMIPLEKWGKTDGLPDARKAYLQAEDEIIEKYGLIPRTIYFDGSEHEEIYPSIVGLTCKKVREAMIEAGEENSVYLPPITDDRIDRVKSAYGWGDGSKEDTEEFPTFTMYIRQVGFDIAAQGRLTSEGHATISMKSGMCAGREFKVKAFRFYIDNNQPELELEKSWDDSIGMAFPNTYYPITEEDEFVLLDIPMPDYYIKLAEDRLYAAAEKLLGDYTRVSAFYEPGIDPIRVGLAGKPLRSGMYMQVYDEDVVDTEDNKDYVLIDTVTINEKSEPPLYSVTLREQKRAARTFGSLEDMIDDAKESVKEESKRNRQYTDRRFSSIQQTLSMLQAAFDEFSPGIDPVTVQTMTLVAGDPRGQFIFTASRQSIDPIPCPVYYDSEAKRVKVDACALVHMTLGIDGLTAPGVRTAGDYFSWDVKASESEFLDEGGISYYVCIKAKKDGTEAELFLTPDPIDLEVDGYYYFYVGVLNSESGGTRDFATIYGFTEVAPGRIVTNVIRSADGTCVFDLENNTITGPMRFLPGTTGIENIEGLTETIQNSVGGLEFGKYNLLRNSGFTGDFVTESLDDGSVLDEDSELFSDPFRHWTHTNATVVTSAFSESGKECRLSSGSLSQELKYKVIAGENYVFSFRGRGRTLTFSVGGVTKTITLKTANERYVEKFVAETDASVLTITEATATIFELQLERGTVVSAWGHSMWDNQSELAKYQSMQYLEAAMRNGSTDILGGLILTNLILLGNPEASDNNAGISGIRNDNTDVAFWGGGTYAQAIDTVMKYVEDPTYQPTDAEVASMAKAVITHGGRAILNDIILRGHIYALGGKIGSLQIENGGISAKTTGGRFSFSPSGTVFTQDDGSFVQIGTGCHEAIKILGKDAGGQCYIDEDLYKIAAQINADDGYHAIHCLSGVFAGLRPNIRKVSASETLDGLDHTIVIENASEITITLPSSPLVGQEYKLIHVSNKKVNLSCSSYDAIIDVSAGGLESFVDAGIIVLTYFDGFWYAKL